MLNEIEKIEKMTGSEITKSFDQYCRDNALVKKRLVIKLMREFLINQIKGA